MSSPGETLINPNSRFKITKAPSALPANCFLCNGFSNRKYFIDTSFSIEFHGAVYICNECLTEMARMVGLVTPEDIEKIRKQNLELLETTRELREKNGVLENAIRVYTSHNLPDDGSPSVVGSISVESEVSDSGTQDSEGELGIRTGTTSESSDDEGVGKLRPDSIKSKKFEL